MTDSRLTRRRLLATAGVALLAGCGDDSSSDQSTSGRFAQSTETSVPTTATATATTEQDDAEINIQTETETETASDRGTRADDQNEGTPTTSETLTAAREALANSFEVYKRHVVENSGDAYSVGGYNPEPESITEITASDTGLEASAVRSKLSTARTKLDAVEGSEDGEQATITELRAGISFMDELVAAQSAVNDVYAQLQTALQTMYAEDFDAFPGPIADIGRKRKSAVSQISTFESNTEPSDTASFEGISPADYEAKVSQFNSELDGFEQLEKPLERMASALEPFEEAVDKYVGIEYELAQRAFIQSNRYAGLLVTEMMSVSVPDSLSETESRLERDSNALQKGTSLLSEAARHGSNNNGTKQDNDYFRGLGELSSGKSLTKLDSYEQLDALEN